MRAGGRRREVGHSLFEIVVEEELGVFSENGAFWFVTGFSVRGGADEGCVRLITVKAHAWDLSRHYKAGRSAAES